MKDSSRSCNQRAECLHLLYQEFFVAKMRCVFLLDGTTAVVGDHDNHGNLYHEFCITCYTVQAAVLCIAGMFQSEMPAQ